MPSYNNYLLCGIKHCQATPKDLSRCKECVRKDRPRCNVIGASKAQLQKIAQFYVKFDREVVDTTATVVEASTRFQRIQKQKEFWRDCLITAFQRSLTNVRKLEEKEKEKTEKQVRVIVETTATNVE